MQRTYDEMLKSYPGWETFPMQSVIPEGRPGCLRPKVILSGGPVKYSLL